MPLRLDDGYTLTGKTSGEGNGGEPVPVVSFVYRPPTAAEMSAFRFALAAAPNGDAQHAERVRFLAARLVTWDVQGRDGAAAPVTAEFIGRVPDPILLDLVNESAKWKPKLQADAAGNSLPA